MMQKIFKAVSNPRSPVKYVLQLPDYHLPQEMFCELLYESNEQDYFDSRSSGYTPDR